MKMFVLYDGRYKYGTGKGVVMCTSESEKEAWEDSKTFKDVDAIWTECEIVENKVISEKLRPDIGIGILLNDKSLTIKE